MTPGVVGRRARGEARSWRQVKILSRTASDCKDVSWFSCAQHRARRLTVSQRSRILRILTADPENHEIALSAVAVVAPHPRRLGQSPTTGMMNVPGKPFDAIMRDSVLVPLGMSGSTFAQPLEAELESKAARAHPGGHRAGYSWRVEPAQSAAGLWTTPTDLARFAIEVQKSSWEGPGTILPRAFVHEMLSLFGVGLHAVGFRVEKRGERWYFAHSGGNTRLYMGFGCPFREGVRRRRHDR